MAVYAFDFETNNDIDDCRVWSWGCVDVYNLDDYKHGTCIDGFIAFMVNNPGEYYAHNAGFDAEFILWQLLYNYGFEHSETKEQGTFQLLMSEDRKFYSLEIIFIDEDNKVVIKDSYKKMPASLERIAKNYGLPLSKGSIDYNKKRPEGYVPTDEEKEYQKHDCLILAMALKLQFDAGLKSLTIGSDALKEIKRHFNFRKVFPVLSLEDDSYIRQGYKGGFTHANPEIEGQVLENGACYDVNSMYPSKMLETLPVGMPKIFDGRYKGKKLYFQSFICTATIKENRIPTVQIKGSYFRENEYLTKIEEPTLLTMTKIDLELFFLQYDVEVYEWCGGMEFQGAKGVFDSFIHHWYEKKKTDTDFLRELDKYMLNNGYGKLATNPDITGRFAETCNDGIVKYTKFEEPEFREPVYTAAGAWITSLARTETILCAQKNYDRFLYCDTDSIFLRGTEPPEGVFVHDSELGAWSLEFEYKRFKVLRQKTYIVETEQGLLVKCAGLNSKKRKELDFDNFKLGLVVPQGKTRPRHVRGGVVIENVDFTLL